MPLPDLIRRAGVTTVTITNYPGTADESRHDAEAQLQAASGYFAIETPIYEGDIVDVPDPRGGTARYLAAEVKINRAPAWAPGDGFTEVVWGKAPAPRVAPVRRLTIENLHPLVVGAAANLFADGHFESAVTEAFKSVEVRVRDLTGSQTSGVKLMGEAFGGPSPQIDVVLRSGQSGADEREGFLALFRGAMLAVRNPRAHDLTTDQDPQEALEYLGFASLLHRRLDAAGP
jgi:uncharacterized protein (TIGR02391 family)